MRFLRRLAYWVKYRDREADLVEEMAFHEEMKRRELVAAGLPPDDAVFAARRTMGAVTLAREEARAVWISVWFESVAQDVTYALRTLRREPGFTAIAIVALAVAIGLNTSVFSAFNALALRNYQAPAAHRMITLYDTRCCQRAGGQLYGFAMAELDYFSARARTIDGVYAWRRLEVGSSTDEASSIVTTAVSGNYFSLLGVRMSLGRAFAVDDDASASPQAVVILSDTFWRLRVGSDSAVIGKTLRIADVPFTVIGVAPPSFRGTESQRVDVWIPLNAARLFPPYDSWTRRVVGHADQCCTAAAARLAPGVTSADALAELTRLSQEYRTSRVEAVGALRVSDFTALASPRAAAGVRVFALLFVSVAVVLLLACANLANLLLARAVRRQPEISTRLAIGANRGRVVRQLVTEALVLALVAGAAGILLAVWLPERLLVIIDAGNTAIHVTPDWRVLAFTLLISFTTCLLFGLAPAIHATRPIRASQSGLGRWTSLRSTLLTTQVALSVVLLVSAGLLVRGVRSALDADRGFLVRDVSVVTLERGRRSYDSARTRAFTSALGERLGQLPESASTAMSSGIPFESVSKSTVRLPAQNAAEAKDVVTDEVSPSYFRVLGIPLVAGRAFEPADAGTSAIVVNETLARLYWNGADALGKTVVAGRPRRIIGIARDVRSDAADAVYARFYEPLQLHTIPNIFVRTSAVRVASEVETVGRQLDARMRARVQPLAVYLEQRLAPDIALGRLATSLAVLALCLATLGMLGVFAFWVQRRQRELGVRIALGAQPRQIVGLVLRGSGSAIGVGLVLGVGAAALSSRFLQGHLYGLSTLDPLSYGVVAAVLAVAGLLAVFVPARRATRIDPALSLRCD